MLLPKIQRTKVESKSQPNNCFRSILNSCYQKYKEQKLKANHNPCGSISLSEKVVTKNTKTKSWKQITTLQVRVSVVNVLLPKIQRTKVESKSQHNAVGNWYMQCCYQKYKEQKLKANHNNATSVAKGITVVTKNTKNKSWKQITTPAQMAQWYHLLLPKIQRTKVESKSQLKKEAAII